MKALIYMVLSRGLLILLLLCLGALYYYRHALFPNGFSAGLAASAVEAQPQFAAEPTPQPGVSGQPEASKQPEAAKQPEIIEQPVSAKETVTAVEPATDVQPAIAVEPPKPEAAEPVVTSGPEPVTAPAEEPATALADPVDAAGTSSDQDTLPFAPIAGTAEKAPSSPPEDHPSYAVEVQASTRSEVAETVAQDVTENTSEVVEDTSSATDTPQAPTVGQPVFAPLSVTAPETPVEAAPATEQAVSEAFVPGSDSSLDGLLIQARDAYWVGDYERAETLYEQALDIGENDPAPYGELGNVYFAQGDWDAAADAYLMAAQRLLAQGRVDEAKHLVLVLQGLNSNHAERLIEAIPLEAQ